MSRFLIFISVLLIGLSTTVKAIHTETVTISFAENDFTLGEYDNGLIEISAPELNPVYENNDEPGIPFFTQEIAIPAGHKFVSSHVEFEKRLLRDNVTLCANPLVYTTNYAGPVATTRQAVCSLDIYPDKTCEYVGKSNWTDFNVIYLKTSPFIYDVANKCLYFIDNMTIEVVTDEELPSLESRYVRANVQMEDFAKSRVVNPESINPIRRISINESVSDSLRIDYVIITNEKLKPSFEPLAKWKRTKGVRSKIVTVEEIEREYEGETIQLKIKNCLYNLYTHNSLKFALLGGDATVVPVQGCYCYAGSTTDENGETVKWEEDDIPTDLFYACFNGSFDWNATKNDKIGEYNDSMDMSPNIYVSRVPVDRAFYAEPFVNKIIDYEQNPKYQHNMLTGGVQLNRKNKNYTNSDVEKKGDDFYNRNIKPHWNGKRYKFYDTATDFEEGSDYDFIGPNVEEQMSKGYNFIQISTHGSFLTWACEDTVPAEYCSMHAGHPGQGGHTIVTTVACSTAAFDDYYNYGATPGVACLATTLLRNPNPGILAYLGCSREGFISIASSSNTVGGLSFEYDGNFYKHLFSDSITDKNFGIIVARAKAELAPKCTYSTSMCRWIQYGLNPLGDPEMPIFTEHPSEFADAKITGLKSSITVDTGVDGCRICVMSSNDDGASYYKVVENVRTETFAGLPEQCNVCITKQNYLPKQFSVRCIKGQTISGVPDGFASDALQSMVYKADVVTIESSKFTNGKITIDSDNVTINSGFTIDNSANISIGKSRLSTGTQLDK